MIERYHQRGLEPLIVRYVPIRPYRCMSCYKRFWKWERFSSGKRRLGSWVVLIVFLGLWLLWKQLPLNFQADNEPSASQNDGGSVSDPFIDHEALIVNTQFNQPADDENIAESNSQGEDAQADGDPLSADIVMESEELRSLLKVDINYVIEQWRQAWQAGNSDKYLGFYSTQFKPSADTTLQDWQQQRRERVVPSKQISIELSDFEVVFDDLNQTAVVTFEQNYQSDEFTQQSKKELTLVNEGGWRIVSEVTLD